MRGAPMVVLVALRLHAGFPSREALTTGNSRGCVFKYGVVKASKADSPPFQYNCIEGGNAGSTET
eukprot:CAMPEP_0117529340 /NCGR_PEP_ID=MMETSP0784-20121206/37783_1 /TAXON_ID=39447 /ORGANISM="" /LENGTH=64 /DNA_ID=CAMNT_0005325661 /DNA_START=321 /DNA_END=515 /DNA_ORIENTATION=-